MPTLPFDNQQLTTFNLITFKNSTTFSQRTLFKHSIYCIVGIYILCYVLYVFSNAF